MRNATFPHAWRYRDYVIDAFNRNTPYDQFLTQQIAGDLLPTKSIEERDENRIATGFLALASKPNAKLNPNFRMDLVADQIDVTTQATMALTVGCARCHDHKFDPIPMRDYYAMAGIFQSSETLYGGGGNSMGAAPVTDLYALGETNKPEPTTDSAAESDRKKVAREDLRRQAQLKVELRQLKSKNNATAAEKTQLATVTKEFKALNVRIKSRAKKRGRSPKVAPKNAAMGVRDRQAIADSRINLKGEFTSLGEAVPRGFVQVVGAGEGIELPKEQSGRLELARWLTSPQHPLTSRVMVNRISLHLFGTGLVGTPDNFGIHGERPSHPQLLDYLATRFMDEGWNVKATIEQIVLSHAYAQSSLHIEKSFQADPYNRLLWRMTPRRLEGEPLRDAILAISGKLDLKRPVGSIVTKYNGALVQDKITTKDFQIESAHRSIYLPVVRNALPEMLGVFDIADPSLVVGRRNVTTVPAQELYLINNEFVVEHSRQTARRVLDNEQMTDRERVNWGYVATFGRQPTDSERNRMLNYLFEMKKELQTSEQDAAVRQEIAWGSLFQALFASTEFRYLN